MMELCRRLSHQNCTVLMVTHNMSNINLCDKIAFLGVGGVLCYYGAPEKLNEYFDVEMTSDIFEKLRDPAQIEHYREKYLRPPSSTACWRSARRQRRRQTSDAASKILKFLRQFVVLVERNLQLIWNDKLLLASLTLHSG